MTTISSSGTSSVGTISSMGIGSGLDVNSIITQLMAAESVPLTQLQQQASSINTQISAVGQITSLSSTLSGKAQALESLDLWNGVAATSSDSSSVSAATQSGAAAGNYSVTVSQLAQGQTVTSSTQPSATSTLNAGTLTIQLGTWSGSTFTAKSGSSPTSITIDSANTSLSAIRDQINAANAGVQASIITDANGSRLAFTSTGTGKDSGFKINATEAVDDGNPATGLSALTYDPSGTASQMSLNQSAQNALVNVNGIGIESASNTLTGVSTGLDLTVSKQTTSPVTITVSKDTASMTTAINGFVTAYNALNSYIHDQTKYDPTAKVGGPLQGDPTIIGFQYALRGIITTGSTASSMYQTLSSIGVSVQTDGSLAVDSTKLGAALQNTSEVQKLFASTGSGSAQGLAVSFQQTLDSATISGGRLDSETQGLRTQLQNNSDQQTNMQTHLSDEQSRLQTQFQALDTTMAQATALQSYLSQQLTGLSLNTKA